MATVLPRGGNTTIASAGAFGPVEVRLISPVLAATIELDPSAFLLTDAGVVRAESDFVFYNNPTSPEQSVTLVAETLTVEDRVERPIRVDLRTIPAAIARIEFALTIYQAAFRRQTFGQVGVFGARVLDAAGAEICRCEFTADAGTETAVVCGELYRRGGDWKFRAVGQGYNGGLAALATRLGVEVEPEAEPPPPANPEAAPYPISQPPPQIKPPAVGPRSAVVQRGQRAGASLGTGLSGEVLITLPRGAADGELACLYELTDGAKGYIGVFGHSWGDYHQKPHIRYFSATVGGDPTTGEALVLNAARLSRISRMLIFSTIAEHSADRQLTVAVPGSRPIEIPVTDTGIVAIALVELNADSLGVTYLGERFGDYQAMDDHYRWGLRWS